ncbi:low molecular weight protein-tyrosine-phosphatase [Caballeronia calidae]|uniref:low molecular weight protein-tyrosine-phosphatase n=1 Tax=Caballeronia calidae TaxID=1777139 RepID=UPI0009419258|nr:low molecular weight protein-tyrosine-phosphatase [Caballeronia calidae]
MITSVLIVCIGNICRSPMAAGLLKDRLPQLRVKSAGLGALIGHQADRLAQDLLSERGIDIWAHRAQPLTEALCADSELILAMDKSQKSSIEQRYPFTRGKVYRLAEFDGLDIFDPYRQDRTRFEACLELIERGVEAWSARIKALN